MFSDSWNKRSQNIQRKAHLLTKAGLKARGITKYDAELVLAQGYALPESRSMRRHTAPPAAPTPSVRPVRRLASSTNTASGRRESADSTVSQDGSSCAASVSSITDPKPPANKPRNKHDRVTPDIPCSQKVPKLKLRISRPSDTETDSSVAGCDTPQPLYEILGNDETGGVVSSHTLHVDDDNSQSTVFSQDENCSQSSLDDLGNDQLEVPGSNFSTHQNIKRLRLKFDGKVDIVNLGNSPQRGC